MLKRALPLLVFVAMAVGASSTFARHSRAAPQQPLSLDVGYANIQFDHRIEKQSWFLDCCTYDPDHTVVNPGTASDPGTWDINDNHRSGPVMGYVAAGTTLTSRTYRHVFDWNPMFSCRPTCAKWSSPSNSFGARIYAPSDTLVVTICYQPQGRCFTFTPVYDSSRGQFTYQGCQQAVYAPDDPAIIDIPGSNGGKGVPSTMVLTITNPSTVSGPKGTMKDVTASWGLSSDVILAPGCVPHLQLPNHDYPFNWIG